MWGRAPGTREEPEQSPNLESHWHIQATEKRSIWSTSRERNSDRR